MKGIRQRGNKWFVDVTHKGRRLTATTDTQEEATAKRIELLHQLVNGEGRVVGGKQKVWTLGQAYEYMLRSERDWKGKHVPNAEIALARFGRSRLVTDITNADIEDWITDLLKQNNSGGTINRKLSALSKMLKGTSHVSGLEFMPIIKRQRESKGNLRWLTTDEERQLLTLLRQWGRTCEYEMTFTLIDTGLRVSELGRLEKQDIDLKARTLTVRRSKNGRPRTLPMTERVYKTCVFRVRRAGSDGDPKLFRLKYTTLQRTFERACGVLGWEDVVLHTLRHTCASRLAQGGFDLFRLMDWMGHTNIQTTRRYSHLCTTDLEYGVKLLEKRNG